MTSVKQRNKSNAGDRNSHASPDDVAKKAPKASKAGSPPGSGIWGKLLAVGFYLALLSAAGIAGFYLQRVLEEVSQINSRHEDSVVKNGELTKSMESVLQQVDSIKQAVGKFDSSLKDTKSELDNTNKAVRKGETDTRRIEEVLHKLQNEILRDLSDGIRDVKEARERDFSSLEQTVEERLTELTKSINDNVSVFTEVQSETQSELQSLKSKIDVVEDLRLLKKELQGITGTVAELQSASQGKNEVTDTVREQLVSLQDELQTRNAEVASTVQEIEEVKEMVQSTATSLRKSLSEVESTIQSLSSQVQSTQDGLQQATDRFQDLEQGLQAKTNHIENNYGTLESRLKAIEENAESLLASASEQSEKLESVLSKYDSHESRLATLGRDVENAKSSASEGEVSALQNTVRQAAEAQEAFGNDMEMLKNNVDELQNAVTALGGAEKELDDSQKQQIEEHEQRLATLEDAVKAQASGGSGQTVELSISELKGSVSKTQTDLQMLRTAVDSLVAYSVKIEGNEREIASLKSLLDETKTSLELFSIKLESVQEKI
ncbi:cytoskeleton-associated protein 4 [Amia ocellicauda]|uniref:cytoskeleton-associated protein 4 n=1 Tax=Amia ocellicauda TaxID=2972642 RepID=UPI00346407AE